MASSRILGSSIVLEQPPHTNHDFSSLVPFPLIPITNSELTPIPRALVNPSCLQTESAAPWLMAEAHTVPHCLFWYTSTRPLEVCVRLELMSLT